VPQRSHLRATLVAALVLVVLSTPAGARAASPITIGTGHKPGVAVDAAGTAYIAWYGAESLFSSLQFCRLPRGASACAHQGQIATSQDSLSRPFVTVSGSTVRVVQYRYGGTSGVFEFVSTNSGDTFGAEAQIGSIPFDEAVQGPGDTLSAATNAASSGLEFQNMQLGGGSAGTALLSADHPYNGSVGLIDASTPLTVFSAGDSQSQFRRYDGSGSVNDVNHWTAPVSVGYADYPRLAGGPTGLFMLAGTAANGLEVRRYDGTTFGAAAPLAASGDDAQDHIAQDAAGRLHAVFPQGAADGLHLIHATSDDGVTWRSGTVLTQATGGIAALRAAVAPDHVGVVAWETGTSGGADIRVAGIGPEAPVDPLPPVVPPVVAPPPLKPVAGLPAKSKPPATARKLKRGRIRVTIKGTLRLPASVSRAQGCRGKLSVTLKRGRSKVGSGTLTIGSRCSFSRVLVLTRKRAKGARRLTLTLRFPGNAALGPAQRTYTLKVR
jgi:hypothetical protein